MNVTKDIYDLFSLQPGVLGILQHSRSQICALLPYGQTVEPHSLFQGTVETCGILAT